MLDDAKVVRRRAQQALEGRVHCGDARCRRQNNPLSLSSGQYVM